MTTETLPAAPQGGARRPAEPSPQAEREHRLRLAAAAASDARTLLSGQNGHRYLDPVLIVEATPRGDLVIYLIPMRSFVLRERAGVVVRFKRGGWCDYIRTLAYNAFALARAEADEDWLPVDDSQVDYRFDGFDVRQEQQ